MDVLSTSLSVINGTVSLTKNAISFVNKIQTNDVFNTPESNKETIEKTHERISSIKIPEKQLQMLKERYPDKVPIIVQKSCSSRLNELPKNKYIIERNLPVASFKYIIQQKLNLGYHQALFLFNEFYIIQNNITIGELYDKKKSEDTVLYLTYCEENAFGE